MMRMREMVSDSGSARASRAADDALVVGTDGWEDSITVVSIAAPEGFGEGAEPDTRGACAPPEMNFSRRPKVSWRRFLGVLN